MKQCMVMLLVSLFTFVSPQGVIAKENKSTINKKVNTKKPYKATIKKNSNKKTTKSTKATKPNKINNKSVSAVNNTLPKNVIYSVYDIDAGKYLEKNLINKVHPLASLTKLMSAHVFLSNKQKLQGCSLEINELDKDHLKNTRTKLPKNQPLNCEVLLKASLALSDNYATSALSRGLDNKNKNDFIKMMNNQAQHWGMTHTSFADPAGLNPKNTSTADDLNKFLRNLLQTDRYFLLSNFSTENKFSLPNYKNANNSNMLIRNNTFDAKLSKTGFINESGYNLVFVPEKCANNKTLALVIMGERNSYSRAALAKKLLNKYSCS